MQPFSAVLSEGRIVIPVKSEADSLYNDGYGNWDEKGVLTLDAYEALYNVEREKITVIDELDNNVFNFRDLVIFFSKTEPRTFTKFIVYKDLRNRGFVTQMIDGEEGFDFQVYDRGSFRHKKAGMNIFIISEGSAESVDKLVKKVKEAKAKKVELKLAVVDRRGEIVYYSLSEKRFS